MSGKSLQVERMLPQKPQQIPSDGKFLAIFACKDPPPVKKASRGLDSDGTGQYGVHTALSLA
ncbi:hypothetical protein GCM10010339_65860 [Streptomyces alanosinicus]|uniref:Uncharacterized protein n=1 Tax=Streptomyces alanosinicus TaxID=68171 RepID=A0A918YPA8_9ACTN|nr:hypothetical protein GCM10010339_65860 [Streptomyces alanosinicus]